MVAASPTGRPPPAPPAPSCNICATPSDARATTRGVPTFSDRAVSMVLAAVPVRTVELIEPLFAADAGGPKPEATVLAVLDQTLTGMGGRLLRQRLLRRPSLHPRMFPQSISKHSANHDHGEHQHSRPGQLPPPSPPQLTRPAGLWAGLAAS